MKLTFTFLLFFLSISAWTQTINFADNQVLFDHPISNAQFGNPFIPFDYNSDGTIDFIGGGWNTQPIMKGLGNDEFLLIDINQGYARSPLKVMDFDNDGDLDVIMENYINLYAEQDSFIFLDSSLPFNQTIVDVSDFNADTKNDLLVIEDATTFGADDSLFVYFNNGSNDFTKQGIFGQKRIHATKMGDMDGDGDLDIIIGFEATEDDIVILINDNNQYTPLGIKSNLYGINSLTVEDIDGDGDLDILANNKILVNTDGYQSTPQIKTVYFSEEVIISKAADLNNDGNLDIIALTRNDDTDILSIYTSESKGAYWGSQQLVTQLSKAQYLGDSKGNYLSNNLNIFDYNQDGKKDIIYTDGHSSPSVIRYFENSTIVGITDLNPKSTQLTLFPNPSNDLLVIETRASLNNKEAQILTANGQVLLTVKMKGNSIDISQLNNGTYFLNIIGLDNLAPLKFVKY